MICVSWTSSMKDQRLRLDLCWTACTMQWYHTFPRYVQSNTINGGKHVVGFERCGSNPFLNVSIMQFQERRGNEGING